MSRLKNLSKGFTLIEVMVAIVLLGVTVATIMELFSINLRSSKRVEDYTEAIIIAKSEMERVPCHSRNR